MRYILSLILLLCSSSLLAHPAHWWEPVPENLRKGSWEILPQEVDPKTQVVLSKRNELGQFSNLAPTPFELGGESFASVEAFWQMMKFPDPEFSGDPRLNFAASFPYTREQVKTLSGFVSKRAGSAANKINKKLGFNWINYRNVVFNYKDHSSGSAFHYELIREAIEQKIKQNPRLIVLLISTKPLQLLPDHKMRNTDPPSYFYASILQDIRDQY